MPDPNDTTPLVDASGGDTPAPQPLADNLDVEELLSLAMTQPDATVPPSGSDLGEADDDDDGDDEDDDESSDEDGEDERTDEGEAAADGVKPPAPTDPVTPEAIQAAGQMLAESPQRINELPRKQRAPAIEEAMRLAYVKGVGDMHARMTTQLSAEEELRKFYDERETARNLNPNEHLDWEDENPEEAAKFAQARAYFKAKTEGKNPALPGMAAAAPAAGKSQLTEAQQTIQNLANREATRLAALPPAAQQAIAAQGFALTEEGLATFQKAITDAEAAARRSTNTPDAVARRQDAHERRKNTARIDPGPRGAGGPPKKNPLADINEPDALLEMAMSSVGSRAG